jgi:drug/metabolite transporter (DMT)-like permease
MLIAGAFLIVAGIVMSVVRWINNDLAQGLVIIATGLAMLGVLSVQMKRAVSQSKTGTPTA